MTTSRVAVVTEFHKPLEIWSVPVPALEPGSVVIRVDAATLCGTDAHRWEGGRAAVKPPFTPGHETCGTIVEMRGEVRDILDVPLKIGDRIISSHPSRLIGGCSEYHYFPPGASFVKVPEEVSSPLAASAACALRTVMHGFELLGPTENHESLLVQGAGPLGLYTVAVAKARGLANVMVIGAPQARLDVAKRWGADHVLDLDEATDPRERIEWAQRLTDGRGPDIVFQCANTPALLEAMQIARLGGRIISIGNSQGAPLSIPQELFFRGLRISSVRMAEARHFYEAIQFIAKQREKFDFDLLLTGRYSLEETGEALKAMAEFREVKPVIFPHKA